MFTGSGDMGLLCGHHLTPCVFLEGKSPVQPRMQYFAKEVQLTPYLVLT